MALNIRPSTSTERRLLFIETLINLTTKVSKVSDNSVLSGIAGGVAKVAGKAEKDIFLAVSQLFPDSAYGSELDQVAANFGIAPRFGAQGSSVYVRLTATPGTVYLASTNVAQSNNGLSFPLQTDITIGSSGFEYVLVASSDVGAKTNIASLTISQISPQPNGHLAIINECPTTQGRDIEDDDSFRARIKDGANILARGTISMLEQLFMLINNKVLRVYHHGIDDTGRVILAIATQNGSVLNQTELDELLQLSSPFFSLTEYKPFGRSWYGITLTNVTYQPFDISFRADLDSTYSPDQIRQDIQVGISKYLDYRNFNPYKDSIVWVDLLEIVKNVRGVKSVPDQFFYPRVDIQINRDQLPRLRGFLMLNKQGAVISNLSGTLSPIYYPAVADAAFGSTVLGM